jgi:hypothetical protein
MLDRRRVYVGNDERIRRRVIRLFAWLRDKPSTGSPRRSSKISKLFSRFREITNQINQASAKLTIIL